MIDFHSYKNGITVALLAIVTYLSCSSAAAESSAANVTIVHMSLSRGYSNTVFIKISATPGGQPTCANHYWDYTLPVVSTFDDKMFASLLAAYAGQNRIDLSGTGTCNEHGQIESLGAIGLKS